MYLAAVQGYMDSFVRAAQTAQSVQTTAEFGHSGHNTGDAYSDPALEDQCSPIYNCFYKE